LIKNYFMAKITYRAWSIIYSSMSQLEHLKCVMPFELQACCYIVLENPFEKLLWFYYQLRAYVFRQRDP